MRKLALLILAVGGVAVVLSAPEAAAQTRCGSAICIGSKNTDTIIGGNISVTSPDGGLSIASGTGAISSAAGITTTGAAKLEIVDAGVLLVNNALQVKSPVTCGAAAACGSIALVSASPSTATVTVPAGVSCACWPVGTTAAIAAGGCAASVSSTTLTLTGPNTVTTTVRYMCFL
jgi:hypothetical protein